MKQRVLGTIRGSPVSISKKLGSLGTNVQFVNTAFDFGGA